MGNPWLEIPLADYEGHMARPEVAQAAMLSDALAALLEMRRPRSLAVVGCAGGNGLERVDPARTARVVGVDINAGYLAETRRRYGATIGDLQLVCADVASDELTFAPVDLIFAALVFEYVDVPAALGRLAARLTPGGVFAALLQRPAPGLAAVTATPFTRLASLAPLLRLVPPATLIAAAGGAGLALAGRQRIALPTGKSFELLQFIVDGQTT